MSHDDDPNRLIIGPDTVAETIDSAVTGGPEAEERRVDAESYAEAIANLPSITESDDPPMLSYGPKLGAGGKAVVRLAEQIPMGREVAVKQIRPLTEWDEETARREFDALLREAWVTGFLEHPNIVPVYRVGLNAYDEPVVLLKRIEGVSWKQVARDPESAPVDIEADDRVRWHLETLIQVCRAIEYAHDRRIIHRDLKPENIMIGEFGEVYVVDWGLAAAMEPIAEHPRLPVLGGEERIVGTPAYMPPEALGMEFDRIGPQTDVYMLGGILYWALTGQGPNSGKSLAELVGDGTEAVELDFPEGTPEPLESICRCALADDIETRFGSVAALRRALQQYLRHDEAMALVDESQRRLDLIRRSIADIDASVDDQRESDLRKEFVRTRFGFEQALELDDSNRRARQGLQTLLETMIDFEVEREEYDAARHFLADLPEARPGLEQRVEQLGERLANRDRELERLQEMEREADVDVSRNARSKFVLVLGGLTAMLNLSAVLFERVTGAAPTAPFMLGSFGVFAAGVGGLVWRARDQLLRNAANRKMFLGLLIALAGDAVFRVMGMVVDVPAPTVAAYKAVMMHVCFMALAVALDLRLLWVGVVFLLVAPLQLRFPDYPRELAAGGVIVGTLLLAWSWWD